MKMEAILGDISQRTINQSINQSMHLTWSIRSANRLVYRYATKKKRNRKNGKKKEIEKMEKKEAF